MGEDKRLCATYLAAMDVLSKPWNGILIAALEDGPLRFSEIAGRVPDIADRVLSKRMKELETRGLVSRHVEHGPPVRVTYALTEVGRGFRAVADAATTWGESLVTDASPRRPTKAPPKRAKRR